MHVIWVMDISSDIILPGNYENGMDDDNEKKTC